MQNRLYRDLAWLWPIFSPPAEYAEDAGHWRAALRARLGPGRHSLLELGCGGGHTLSHLTADFSLTAADLSPDMLALSAALNPGVIHYRGDMRTIRLGRAFAAILIHDAIDYMLTAADLRAVFATAKAHLEPGGILLISPDYFRETFAGPTVQHWIRPSANLDLTVIEYCYDPDPADTTIESLFFFLLREAGGDLRVEQDRHSTGLFPSDLWLQLLTDAGFAPELIAHPGYAGGYGGHLIVATLG